MTPDEKYDVFKELMISTDDKHIVSPKVEETYKRSIKRWFDVLELKDSDRVPNYHLTEGFIAQYGGITHADIISESQ